MKRKDTTRLPTGAEGLDTILRGGLLHPSSYLLAGGPGTGKTVLGSQIAFSLAAQGTSSLFISVLTEPYSHLMRNLGNFSFFDDTAINKELTFVSAFSILEEQGLPGLEEMLRLSLPRSGAKLVVLDNIGMLDGYAASALAYRAFLQKVISLSTMAGATLLASTDRPFSPAATEYGSFDLIIKLSQRCADMRTYRTLEVRKSRGSFSLGGMHVFEISKEGIEAYPRLESGWLGPPPDRVFADSLAWGVEGLADLAGGGVRKGTVTAVVGPTGAGRTTFASAFADAAIRAGEGVLFVTHHESPSQIVEAAKGLGLDLEAGLRSGLLDLLWMKPGEFILDKATAALLARLDKKKPYRLIVDDLDVIRRDASFSERISLYLSVLAAHLRGRGITTLFTTQEAPEGRPEGRNDIPWSSIENIICLQYDMAISEGRKSLRILKTRGHEHDPTGAALELTKHGVRVRTTPSSGPTR